MTVAIAEETIDQALSDVEKLAVNQASFRQATATTASTKTTSSSAASKATTTQAAQNATTATQAAQTATTAKEDNSCGEMCLEVDATDPLCKWNPEEVPESKTDYHIEKTGSCPCPDNKKDDCQVVQRRIRNIPALQAWSASLFLMSICIAGKIYIRTPKFSVIFQSLIVILHHP